MPPIDHEKGVPPGITDKYRERLAEQSVQKFHADNAWLAMPFKPKELRTLTLKE